MVTPPAFAAVAVWHAPFNFVIIVAYLLFILQFGALHYIQE